MKAMHGLMKRRKEKMKYLVPLALELSAKMIHCSILTYVVLKHKGENKRLRLNTVYMAGVKNLISDG